MQIAELVPEVAFSQGFAVRGSQVLAAGQRFEHREVGGAWLVQSREHRVYGPDAALGRDYEARPALARVGRAALVRDGLEGAHSRSTYGHDPATRGTHRVHQAG